MKVLVVQSCPTFVNPCTAALQALHFFFSQVVKNHQKMQELLV